MWKLSSKSSLTVSTAASVAASPRRWGTYTPASALAAILAAILALLAGCATPVEWTFERAGVPPLHVAGRTYTVSEALAVPSPDVLAVNDEMRDFVEKFAAPSHSERGKLQSLHWAVRDREGLDLRYDAFADGDAATTFERGTANCLSYAHLFVALAREAGLDARYQWMEVRPEWHRIGERVAVRLHVNVQVKTPHDGNEYMLDIDPLRRSEVAGARLMSDAEGLALHHNNLAMVALADDRPAEAWMELLRGIRVAPFLSQLWVNLGAIYRYQGQLDDAESAYLKALAIDARDQSAINNLAVLYEQQGRFDEQTLWLDRLKRYRERNPYYHASLGDAAMEAGDWETAYAHYRKARRLQPNDGHLIYSLGLAERRRGNLRAAEKLLAQAVDKAAFPREREHYQVQLRNVREEQSAYVKAPEGDDTMLPEP
jgi:tetratricopeptide (TPR) repeat protein